MSLFIKRKNRIVTIVDDYRIPGFLKKYPMVEKTMMEFVGTRRKAIDSYVGWLNKYGNNNKNLGGRPETVNSPSFGSKTFYKFDWDGIGGFAEIFQYLIERKLGNES